MTTATIRRMYVHASDESTRRGLRELYPELCNNKMGVTTIFSKDNLFGDQLSIDNNGKRFCRFTMFFGMQKGELGIGINDDGTGIRFKLVDGKDKSRAEQYLIPIYPKQKTIPKLKVNKKVSSRS